MPQRKKDQWSRDDEQQPGRPPRAAAEPGGAEQSVGTRKTRTDPGSGAPVDGPPAPERSAYDRTDGARR